MRSLFAKTLLWFLATTAVAIAGIIITTAATFNSAAGRGPLGMLLSVQTEEAARAYETGGREALAAALGKFQQITQFEVLFTDSKGTDLLTGKVHPELMTLPKPRSRWRLPYPFGGRPPIIARQDATHQYRLFLIDQRRNWTFFFLQPQHLWIIGLVVLLCYAFAYHLTSPVRRLRAVVENFGHGDLSARSATNRKDELGQLARSFNLMADRIQTLLSAERRLLLDISHELRSPLARLGVAVELARTGEDLQAALNRIQKESDRLNALLSLLLQVTRAEGDPASLRRDPVQLDELVQQLVDESTIEASARGCQLQYQAGEPVTVEGDAELLRRAMENVIRNAIRYSPPATAVEISLARRNGTAIVDVRDRGPGVPEEALPRLFDAFYRVEKSRDSSSGGIGLGLSIARRAIELHKGGIRARNAQPGLEVVMELPIAKA